MLSGRDRKVFRIPLSGKLLAEFPPERLPLPAVGVPEEDVPLEGAFHPFAHLDAHGVFRARPRGMEIMRADAHIGEVIGDGRNDLKPHAPAGDLDEVLPDFPGRTEVFAAGQTAAVSVPGFRKSSCVSPSETAGRAP